MYIYQVLYYSREAQKKGVYLGRETVEKTYKDCSRFTHPMGFIKSTRPTRGVRVRRTHPSQSP